MTATTATDINGVEYYFDCTVGGGPDSGWQDSPDFTASGLSPGTEYTYVVRARDSVGNTTGTRPRNRRPPRPRTRTAPNPNPMCFASVPTALGTTSITMTATTATDPSGVKYEFECTAGGGNGSGWQDSPTYTDIGLAGATQYTYRVRARDKSAAQTATDSSGEFSATTDTPDLTSPEIFSLSPIDGASSVSPATSLVATFDEDIAAGTGNIVIKRSSDDSVVDTIAVTAGNVSVSDDQLIIDPLANLPADTAPLRGDRRHRVKDPPTTPSRAFPTPARLRGPSPPRWRWRR